MDHDRLFKELLDRFFLDFLRLFVPVLAGRIEEASLVPLDKEIFSAEGRHEVDLLVRAQLREIDQEEPSIFLIHVETQASSQAGFSKRMFRYFARLTEKHDMPVYPIAMFTYEAPGRPEPETYVVELAGDEILRFRFRVIQLNRLSWKEFRDMKNPVACALMAKMGVAPEDRARVKWECYRLLATLKLDPAKSQFIAGFVNAYLELDTVQEQAFQAEIAKAAPEVKEAIMELTNPWIEKGRKEGMEKGLEQGLERGRHREAASMALRLLKRRLDVIGPDREAALMQLAVERLESLADVIFEIRSLDDLDAWLKS